MYYELGFDEVVRVEGRECSLMRAMGALDRQAGNLNEA